MEIQSDNNKIDIENLGEQLNSNISYEQNLHNYSNSMSACMQNEDSSFPLLSQSTYRQNNDSLEIESEFQNKSIVSLNDVIFEKLKRIEQGTYNKEDFERIEAIAIHNHQNEQNITNESNKLLSSGSFSNLTNYKVEWKDMNLMIGEKSKKALLKENQHEIQKKYRLQQMKSMPVTHIMVKELQTKNIFYLIGNIIIDFKSGVYFDQNVLPSGKSTIDDLEESRVVNNAMKQIVQIENNFQLGEVSVSLCLNVKPMEEFQFISQTLRSQGNTKISNQIAIYLDKYQNSIASKQREYILRAIQRAQECNVDFSKLLQERTRLMKELHKKMLDEYQLSHSGFYVLSYFCADFNSCENNLQYFAYSYPLLALLGFEPNQFSNGVSKKGLQMWISPYTRALLLLSSLRDWCRDDFGQSTIIDPLDPFYFKTLDEMIVSCTAKKVRQFIKYEGMLQYIFEGVMDSVNVIIIDIDLFTIKRILSMRKDFVLHQKATQFIDDFEYNIQSQIFLEKYYNDAYENYVQEQQYIQKINEKKAIDDTKICQYRLISQQPPQTVV